MKEIDVYEVLSKYYDTQLSNKYKSCGRKRHKPCKGTSKI